MRSPFVCVCLIQFPPVKSVEIVVHIGIKPLVLVQIQHPSISKNGPRQVTFLYTQNSERRSKCEGIIVAVAITHGIVVAVAITH